MESWVTLDHGIMESAGILAMFVPNVASCFILGHTYMRLGFGVTSSDYALW
jgi:hypothetical protein